MSFAAAPSRDTALAQINVTPLVDVMLVLLIIFMVTAPLLSARLLLNLPGSDGPTPITEPLQIDIDAGGAAWWQGAQLDAPLLQTLFSAEAARDPVQIVQLRVHPQAGYADMVRVFGQAQAAGLRNIGLVGEGGVDPLER